MSAAPIDTAPVTKEAGPKWSKKYHDEDADMELISSDGTHFKVHSYRLQSASTIFRSMIQMGTTITQKDPITFTDEEIEDEDVIEVFLDVIYTWSIENLGHSDYSQLHSDLIAFARKWECQTILKMMERGIKINVEKHATGDLFEQFFMAIALENYEIAGACLCCSDERWAEDERSAHSGNPAVLPEDRCPSAAFKNLGTLPNQNVFDLSASNYDSFSRLPSEVAWALLRSWNIAKNVSSEENFETKLGDEFVKIMRTAYPLAVADATTGSKKRDRDET